jgi:hypothetical protein
MLNMSFVQHSDVFRSRTMIIYAILILMLCIIYKLKINQSAYFNHVNFATLFFGNLVLALQLVSFCIINAQLFEMDVRAIVATFIIYSFSTYLHWLAIPWPTGIQYIFVFISPFVAAHSIFQVGNISLVTAWQPNMVSHF